MGCTSSGYATANPHGKHAGTRLNPARDEKALRCFRASYDVGEMLGRGSTADVYAARPTASEDGTWGFAAKVIELLGENPISVESLKNEFELWRTASQSKHIVQVVEAFHEPMRFIVVAHRCDSGLITHLWNMPQVTETTLSGKFSHMLTGLAHIHSLGIAHRDLKLDNFLVNDGVVKISDFGLARLVASGTGLPGFELQGVAGTPPFMPPEMVRGEFYGMTCDIWSIGVVAYVLLLGNFPYEPKQRTAPLMKQAIAEGRTPPNFKPCSGSAPLSEVALAFLRALLRRDPALRLDANRALSEPYIGNCAQPPSVESTLGSVRPALRQAMRIGACSQQRLSDPKADADIPVLIASVSTCTCGSSSPIRGRARADSADSMASVVSVQDGAPSRQYSSRFDTWFDQEFSP